MGVAPPPDQWILDDGPLGILSGCVDVDTVADWPCSELLVASQTAKDAAQRTERKALLDMVSKIDGDKVFGVITIPVSAPAGVILYSHFRRTESRLTANLAEHEVFSWILQEDVIPTWTLSNRTFTSSPANGFQAFGNPPSGAGWSMIRVDSRTYSVPSRLIGFDVEVHQHPNHLELFYKDHLIETMPRLRGNDDVRIDYRHISGDLSE